MGRKNRIVLARTGRKNNEMDIFGQKKLDRMLHKIKEGFRCDCDNEAVYRCLTCATFCCEVCVDTIGGYKCCPDCGGECELVSQMGRIIR